MNKLTQTLLGSSALCALMAAPVMAQPAHPAMHVVALHAGHAVNKTQFHIPAKHYLTYTFGIYSSLSASSVQADVRNAYYKWTSFPNGYLTCSNPRQKLKTPKKTVYGSTTADTETYSFNCGPTVFYGPAWTNETGVPGNVDTFRSTLIGKFKGPSPGKYKGTLNLDVQVTITQ